jgi:hypothetical protein
MLLGVPQDEMPDRRSRGVIFAEIRLSTGKTIESNYILQRRLADLAICFRPQTAVNHKAAERHNNASS